MPTRYIWQTSWAMLKHTKSYARNAFFAHLENVLIAMLSDDDKNVCQLAINKVQSTRGNVSSISFIAHSEESGTDANSNAQLSIRQFVLPKLSIKAKSYHKLVNLNAKNIEDPHNKRFQ